VKEALLYQKLPQKKVRCQVCSHFCLIAPQQRGLCGVRENQKGKLYSLVCGKVIAVHIDPIEKKPLYHFLSGTQSLSIATVGCNFRCKNCFLPETYIINQDGPITVNEIFDSGNNFRQRKDESIITDINPHQTITHKGTAQKIIHGFKHPFEGEIIKIKPMYVPEIKCTPGHEFFVAKEPKKGKIQKIKAYQLNQNHWLVVPKKYYFPKKRLKLDLKKILSTIPLGKYNNKRKISEKQANQILELSKKISSREIGKLFGLHPGYVRTFRAKLKKGNIFSTLKEIILIEKNNKIRFTNEKGDIPRFIKLDKNFAKLLGYYCGEGNVFTLKNRPNSHRLIFTFGKHEKDKVRETLNLVLKIFGTKARIQEQRTGISVILDKTSIALLFKKMCGSNALSKRIPDVLNRSPKKIISVFLKGYISCDGWINKDAIIAINTVSKNLALGIYWLWLKLGYLPSFYRWDPPPFTQIENRKVHQHPLYYVKLQAQKFRDQFLFPDKKLKLNPKSEKSVKFLENSKYWFVPIWKISKEEYSGWVYNMEVKKEHSYLANFISVGNCQNHEISQGPKPDKPILGQEMSPEKIVREALDNHCPSISYTYTEPTIFLEYALETMKLAKEKGLKNIWVTNGFMSPQTLNLIIPYLDAANVDLKSFDDNFYQKYCNGQLKPVLANLKELKRKNIWLEITTLIIPGLTDQEKMLKKIAQFIKKELGPETPWHISRFFPEVSWQLQDLPATSLKAIEKTFQIGLQAGLKYVYKGNI